MQHTPTIALSTSRRRSRTFPEFKLRRQSTPTLSSSWRQTRFWTGCAFEGGDSIPLLEVRRDSCLLGTRTFGGSMN